MANAYHAVHPSQDHVQQGVLHEEPTLLLTACIADTYGEKVVLSGEFDTSSTLKYSILQPALASCVWCPCVLLGGCCCYPVTPLNTCDSYPRALPQRQDRRSETLLQSDPTT